MSVLSPGPRTRRIWMIGLVVILIGGGVGSGAHAEQTPDPPEKLFSGEGELPTWAVDTERFRQDQPTTGARQPRTPGNLLSDRVKLVLMAGLVLLHLLLSIVVFLDLRRSRPKMSGLWIWIVVLGGVLAAIAYALFRRNRLLQRGAGSPTGDSAEEEDGLDRSGG